MRARDLAITYPSLTPDAPAEEAARLLADEAVKGVFVQDDASLVVVCEHDGRLLGGITTSRLIRHLLGTR